MVMLSLPRIFDDAPVAYLTPGVRRKARSLLTRATTDPVWYGCLLSSHGESRVKYNLTESIPLQVEPWPLSSLCNPSANLALVFVPRRYTSSNDMFTPAISPITGRFVEGGSVFLPVQVQRTYPLPPTFPVPN